MEFDSKTNKKIIKGYNCEYFKSQINQKYTDQEAPKIYSQGKIDVKLILGFMKAIFVFTHISVRDINKVKRELDFVLIPLNI